MQHILQDWRRNVIFFLHNAVFASSTWSKRWRGLLAAFLLAGAVLPGAIGMLWREAMVAVVFDVLVFLIVVLAAFHGVERVLKIDASQWLARHAAWQVPVAAFLGLLPGCAGALVVVAAYVQGGVRFAAVVATAIATMGDAAFLLLAQAPTVGFFTIALSGLLGLVVGIIYQWLDNQDPAFQKVNTVACSESFCRKNKKLLDKSLPGAGLWLGLFLLTLPMALAKLLIPTWFAALPFDLLWFCAWGLLAFTAVLWLHNNASDAPEHVIECSATLPLPSAVAQAASAMAIWVLLVYLLLALATVWLGADLLPQAAFFSPLWAALLGIVPGCGAQVLVTSLYLEGALPYAAQLANAISNSGEALLPLLLVFPRLFWRVSFITFFLGLALAYLPWWW